MPHGDTEVIEPHPTRDYTERMLAAFGWPIAFAPGRAKLEGGHRIACHRRRRAGRLFLGRVLPGRRQHRAGLRTAPACGGPESAPHRPAAGAAPDGRRHHDRTGTRKRRRAGGRSGGAPRAAAWRRAARGAGAGHDRRVPRAVHRRGGGQRQHGHPRRGRTAREGIRPHRDDGQRPARARRSDRGNPGRRNHPRRQARCRQRWKATSTIASR